MDWIINFKITTRKEAKELGLTKYFTGNPCIHGHISERRVQNSVCVECKKIKYRQYCEKNNQHYKGYHKRYREENKERISQYHKQHGKQYCEKNKGRIKQYKEQYREKNKEKIQQYSKQYRENNKEIRMLRNKTRQRRFRRATPPWANLNRIMGIYREAKELGMHVDHVIPLNGKNVSGLHVETNLQIMEPIKNLKKSNKF